MTQAMQHCFLVLKSMNSSRPEESQRQRGLYTGIRIIVMTEQALKKRVPALDELELDNAHLYY